MNFLSKLLDLIYKKKCYFCGNSYEAVKMCTNCYEELTISNIQTSRVINDIKIYSAGIYEKNLQKLIRGLKYHKQKELAYYLAKFLYNYIEKLELDSDFQIIPVPLHKNRIKKRKYNHMELVANELANLTGWNVNNELITRIKDTKPQYKLTKKERMKNLENAFQVRPENSNGKKLMIIDDICTTGSTFEAMINILKENNINEIVCISASSP